MRGYLNVAFGAGFWSFKKMQIDTSLLIGRKCAEFADALRSVLLKSKPASESAADSLSHVADLACCGLNALHTAARASDPDEFISSYDRACAHYKDAARWVREFERPVPVGNSSQPAQALAKSYEGQPPF